MRDRDVIEYRSERLLILMVGAKVLSLNLHVSEFLFSHIYSKKIILGV